MKSSGPTFDGIYGATANPLRLIFMAGLVQQVAQHSPGQKIKVLEVGSWCGASTLIWGEAIQAFVAGGAGHITCVDAWQPYVDLTINQDGADAEMDAALRTGEPLEVFRHNAKFLPSTVRHEVHQGWSQDVLPTLDPSAYDIVYLDGDHTYGGVKSDLSEAQHLVKVGGVLCGDDLELQSHQCDLSVIEVEPNIDKFLDPPSGIHFHPGVTKAVGEMFGPVSVWFGFWAVRKTSDGWENISLDGMPVHIPSFLSGPSLIGLKALLMEHDLI